MSRRPITLPKREVGSPSLAYTSERLKEKLANYRMANYRSVPVARRAWHVTLTIAKLNQQALDLLCVRGLPAEPQSFWMMGREEVQKIVELDHRAGGQGHAEAYEYRRCRVCKRALIGAEGHAYREKVRLPIFTWEFKVGPTCGVECGPKGKAGKTQPRLNQSRITIGNQQSGSYIMSIQEF